MERGLLSLSALGTGLDAAWICFPGYEKTGEEQVKSARRSSKPFSRQLVPSNELVKNWLPLVNTSTGKNENLRSVVNSIPLTPTTEKHVF